MQNEGISAKEMDDVLNRKSGLLGVSGVSSDCREVIDAANAGNDRARLALDMLIHYTKKIIGSYVAEMNGVDVIVFTAGIGENDRWLRERITADMDALGVKIDCEINNTCPRGQATDLSASDARVHTMVIPTDEEYMIALDTLSLVNA
ncbi:MAG: hypothetical protein IJF08_05925 [Clostridia bacterium]|nr:hypothetical protein [Clostridia bacterium]